MFSLVHVQYCLNSSGFKYYHGWYTACQYFISDFTKDMPCRSMVQVAALPNNYITVLIILYSNMWLFTGS